jgi:hypothetical protein
VRPDDLLRRGHAPGRFGVRRIDLRLPRDGVAELAAADRDDAARAADLFLLLRQRQGAVRAILRLVPQRARERIEAQLVTVPGVGHRLRALHDVQPEVQAVPPEDVTDVLAADDDQLAARFFGDALEAGGAHLARGPDGEAIAGDHERLSAMNARAEVRHQIPERTRLPALVEGGQALGHAVGRRGDLVRVDGVQLPREPGARQAGRIPEDQRTAANDCLVRRRGRGVGGGLQSARLHPRGLDPMHTILNARGAPPPRASARSHARSPRPQALLNPSSGRTRGSSRCVGCGRESSTRDHRQPRIARERGIGE